MNNYVKFHKSKKCNKYAYFRNKHLHIDSFFLGDYKRRDAYSKFLKTLIYRLNMCFIFPIRVDFQI